MLAATLFTSGCAVPQSEALESSAQSTGSLETGETGAESLCGASGELDREADCLLSDEACGYPGPGAQGRGFNLGQRMENFVLTDCEGTEREFAEFFQAREDDYGEHNRVHLLSLAAGWCQPCIEETQTFPALYAEAHPRGLELVQVLFQDAQAQPPTLSWCRDWRDTYGLENPVFADQIGDLSNALMHSGGLPVTLLIDANANIRFVEIASIPMDIEGEIEAVLESPCG